MLVSTYVLNMNDFWKKSNGCNQDASGWFRLPKNSQCKQGSILLRTCVVLFTALSRKIEKKRLEGSAKLSFAVFRAFLTQVGSVDKSRVVYLRISHSVFSRFWTKLRTRAPGLVPKVTWFGTFLYFAFGHQKREQLMLNVLLYWIQCRPRKRQKRLTSGEKRSHCFDFGNGISNTRSQLKYRSQRLPACTYHAFFHPFSGVLRHFRTV